MCGFLQNYVTKVMCCELPHYSQAYLPMSLLIAFTPLVLVCITHLFAEGQRNICMHTPFNNRVHKINRSDNRLPKRIGNAITLCHKHHTFLLEMYVLHHEDTCCTDIEEKKIVVTTKFITIDQEILCYK